jgi:hypothetical protein
MAKRTSVLFPALVTLLVAACGTESDTGSSSTEGASGSDGAGLGTGGALPAVGGSPASTGGALVGAGGSAIGVGGTAVGAGGTVVGVGGTVVSTGGAVVGSGGEQPGLGGALGTGGDDPGVGGALGTGGDDPGVGGALGTGGDDPGVGGALGTGGDPGSCGDPGSGGDSGTGGDPGTGGDEPGLGGAAGSGQDDPVCDVVDPDEYELNLGVGGGQGSYETSEHFAIFGSSDPGAALNIMEAAHQCFVRDWCWRTTGLSRTSDDGTYNKLNMYLGDIDAGGFMGYDYDAGLAYLEIRTGLDTSADVTVHEYGHALTLTADGWVDQGNTGFWWESVANFVADSFLTSDICADARSAHGISTGRSIIDLDRTIGNSHWTICMNQNYYQAWPFLTYLTTNPDNYDGLGRMILPDMFSNHPGNNETPLHVLEMLTSVPVQTILGRYWARMAYLDIGHPIAQDQFFNARGGLNFDNLTSVGTDTYEPISGREPKYGGANIIPLDVTGNGDVSIQVTNLGNGLSESNFTATLSILSGDGSVRYVDLPDGSGQATIGADEEASLVVVNTPDTLYMYDPQDIGADPSSDPANTGLNYQVQITGAVPTN